MPVGLMMFRYLRVDVLVLQKFAQPAWWSTGQHWCFFTRE